MDKLGVCRECRAPIHMNSEGELVCEHECEGDLVELLVDDGVAYRGRGTRMPERPADEDVCFALIQPRNGIPESREFRQ